MKRPIWTTNEAPGFVMRSRESGIGAMTGGTKGDFLESLPSFNRIINPFESLNETVWQTLYVMLNDPQDVKATEALMMDFQKSFSPSQSSAIKIHNYFDSTGTVENV